MKSSFKTYFLQPYPFYYQHNEKWVIALILFFMTLFFGYLFEPFNVYHPEHKMDYFWITVIHSTTPLAVVILFSLIPLGQDIEERWNLVREAILVSMFLLIVGIIQFLIRDLIYDNPDNWSWRYLFEEIRNTFLVGILFAAILIPINFIRLNTKNNQKASLINKDNAIAQTDTVIADDKTNIIVVDDLEFAIGDFVFAKAEGNYVAIYLSTETSIRTLKRGTIKELELLLTDHQNIVKTHRSYFVNLDYIKNVKGNAQGYKLNLHDIYEVPVARSMIANFESKMYR